jgi:hypothetical protein
MTDYPLPKYAAYIWTVGDELFIGFPPTVGEKGHTVRTKADAYGIGWAIHLLKARESSDHQHKLHIGHRPTEPCQYQLDAIIKAMKQHKSEPKIDGSQIQLEDLDI